MYEYTIANSYSANYYDIMIYNSSLQDVSLDADIPLGQTLRMAAHLVGWGRGIPIYPLSESNMYISSPTSDPRV